VAVRLRASNARYAELMSAKQIFGLKPESRRDKSATSIPSERKIASIGPDDAIILS
jgi:hypothetical protein